MRPEPARVRYNDWRQVDIPAPEAFTPILPVSVIIPTYEPHADTLKMTLAALEGQTYPRDLFEVVIVDDGSDPPVERPRSTPLNVKVVRQQNRGFGAARARNTGVRAAAHDILLFLDSDMLAEAGWMAAHARWHHAVSDALTLGFRNHVAVDGLDVETIRCRTGSLKELFSDRPTNPPFWIKAHMLRTGDLRSRADDLFRVVTSGNFGIRKDFYWLAGGFDESFTRYSGEDIELGYRAYTRGGLLVPVRDAFSWHLDLSDDNRDAKARSGRIQHGKLAHLIAHRGFVRRVQPGRIYRVPQFVVTIDAGHLPAEQVFETVANILADREHDLVVRIETPADDDNERLAWLRDVFGPDPRVRIAPARSALDAFPVSSFHVTLPASVVFAPHLVHRLRIRLRGAVAATVVLPGATKISITRAWALHRARRAGGSPADFGEARKLSARSLRVATRTARDGTDHASWTKPMDRPTDMGYLLDMVRNICSFQEAWWLLKGLVNTVRRRLASKRRHRATPG